MSNINSNNTYLLNALNNREVKYLVVGGRAVQHYWPERSVNDLDLMIYPSFENAKKVKDGLTYLVKVGFDCICEKKLRDLDCRELAKLNKQLTLKKTQFSTKNLCIDILTPNEYFDYESAFCNSIGADIYGISVCMISCFDQIKLLKISCDLMDKDGKRGSTDYKKCQRDIKMLKELCKGNDTSIDS